MKPVNLNHARKDKTRADAKAMADENSVRFGRTKAQKVLEAAQVIHARDRLTQLKLEDE